MKSLKLQKKIKAIIAQDCLFQVSDDEDGLIIEIKPLPPRLRSKGSVCAPKFDMFNNLIGCSAVDCSAGCRVCVTENDDYYCKCGPCPPLNPTPTPTPSPRKATRKRAA